MKQLKPTMKQLRKALIFLAKEIKLREKENLKAKYADIEEQIEMRSRKGKRKE